MARVKRIPFSTDEMMHSMKVWGCLADATPFKLYESYSTYQFTKRLNQIFTDWHIEKFQENIKKDFGVIINIKGTERMHHIINKVRDKLKERGKYE